jgi:hypothetical protein
MKFRPAIGILIICLMLQYSIGGLSANAIFLNDSGMANNSITVPLNTTTNKLNATQNNVNNTTANNTTLNYDAYPLNCPKWDDYKDKHLSDITNFNDYWRVLKSFVIKYTDTDDYNIQVSKANYNNNTGYFSGNPIGGDLDYRYMPTSKLNEAYSSASLAKSRISIPNSLSTNLQATYTVVAVVLGAASGICGVITTIAGVATASSAGTFSPVLIVCIVISSMVVATTITVGICTAVVAKCSSGINVESGKIDQRVSIMNAELVYRSTLPANSTSNLTRAPSIVTNKTNSTLNVSETNETLNTTQLNTTNNSSIVILNNLANSKTEINNNTNKTNNTNATSSRNIIGINDVAPSTEPIPDDVRSNRSGTFMDTIYDVDISGFPQEPSKPHAKWYEFWKWIDYGADYLAWMGKSLGWGCTHLDSLNTFYTLCKGIQSDYNNL